MTPFEGLYRRRCKSSIVWFKVSEAELLGPDLVYQAMEEVKLIEERLKMAQSRQKSYTDVRQRDLELEVIDWVFLQVSPMKDCMGDPSWVVPIDSITAKNGLTYEEVPVAILGRQVCKLRNKEVASVKVLWRSQKVVEATWEAEEDMKSRYPHLFEESQRYR
ncbi:uncharacterized protein LOC132031640 [Lycium ferocissimum]|uniref:uncharacterized protein LOC132031640 n=1 Tax=Lycium ferocissimum TaxID=112874 RepID=UPI00281664A3|nr:uncharacterized protein LOC132031640 [Lycium ferocissimum]